PKAPPGGLSVMYQLLVFVAPMMVSQTRVVPTTRWPQPVVAPAGPQSSPPGIPPWKRSYGRTNDCWSLPYQPPLQKLQLAKGAVQFETQGLRAPLLLPCQKRRLEPVPTGSIRA